MFNPFQPQFHTLRVVVLVAVQEGLVDLVLGQVLVVGDVLALEGGLVFQVHI